MQDLAFVCDAIDLVLGVPVSVESINSTFFIVEVPNFISQFAYELSIFEPIDKVVAVSVQVIKEAVSEIKNFLLVIIRPALDLGESGTRTRGGLDGSGSISDEFSEFRVVISLLCDTKHEIVSVGYAFITPVAEIVPQCISSTASIDGVLDLANSFVHEELIFGLIDKAAAVGVQSSQKVLSESPSDVFIVLVI
jgi:hypothetical protein